MSARNLVFGMLVIAMLLPAAAAAQEPMENGTIHRWDGRRWVQVPGGAIRISVGPNGIPWVVNAAFEIYRFDRNGFVRVPGGAKDITIDGRGIPWVIGTDDRVYRWNGMSWDALGGRGVAIGVEDLGVPWLVDRNGRILYGFNNGFEVYPGAARDIGAGTAIWVIGSDFALYRLTPDGWFRAGGTAVRVSAGPPGTAWVVNAFGEIYRYQNGGFRRMPGEAIDIAANANGDAWIVSLTGAGAPPNARPR